MDGAERRLLREHRDARVCAKDYGQDVLDNNIMDDNLVQCKDRLAKYGIDCKKLDKWEKKYPFYYAWSEAYEKLRTRVVNKRFALFYPLIIAMCESEEDVQKAFGIAKKYNIPFSIRGGAHCMEGFCVCDGIVIDQSRRDRRKIDGDLLRAEPGVLLGKLVRYLSKHGKVLPTGSCPNVGLAGLSMGGGIGFYDRRLGATCDRLKEARVLLASGEIITASEKEHADLLWALRGAGCGNFGIVVGLTFELTDYSKKLIFYELAYDFADLEEALALWCDWAPNADTRFGAEFRFNNGLASPPTASGIFFGSEREVQRLLEPLRNLRRKSENVEALSNADCARKFAGIGRWPHFSQVKNGFIDQPLPRSAFRVIAKWMARGNGKSIFELNALGGAFNEPKPSDTAFVHRRSIFWFLLNCHWQNVEDGPAEQAWLQGFYQAFKLYLGPGVYQNMPDRELANPLEAYYGRNLLRLTRVKAKYDPKNLFRFDQSIPVGDSQ